METINGERVLWFNRYVKYAITTSPCEICTNDVNIYWIEKEPVKVFSACCFDVGAMLPTLNEFVEGQYAQDAAEVGHGDASQSLDRPSK